jgi:hypothetical protein
MARILSYPSNLPNPKAFPAVIMHRIATIYTRTRTGNGKPWTDRCVEWLKKGPIAGIKPG